MTDDDRARLAATVAAVLDGRDHDAEHLRALADELREHADSLDTVAWELDRDAGHLDVP
jgi:hypothetical protein